MNRIQRIFEKGGMTPAQFGAYLLKCILGTSLVYPLYILLPDWRVDTGWMMVSLMLSITHDNNSKAATDRMKGNIVGSLAGLGCWFVRAALAIYGGFGHDAALFISILSGIILVLAICLLCRIVAVARTALVAFFIVMIYEDNHQTWQGALLRMSAVVAGCVLGLLVNRCFARANRSGKDPLRNERG